MKVFDAQGHELVPPNPDELEHICKIGGQFDECSFYIEFQSESLDREAITAGLALAPTKAWNAGERHPIGNGRTGKTRILEYGKWYVKVPVASGSISSAIESFLLVSAAPVVVWHEFSHRWDGRISLVGHATNWNREFTLSREVVALLAERGLELNVDAYFDGNTSDQ